MARNAKKALAGDEIGAMMIWDGSPPSTMPAGHWRDAFQVAVKRLEERGEIEMHEGRYRLTGQG